MYTVIKGGCQTRHPNTFIMSRPEGLPNYLILIIHTAGIFQIGGKEYSVSPQQALIISPDTPYSYQNPKGDYIDDWLHFDISASDTFKEKNYMFNQPFPVKNIKSLSFFINQILWENSYTDSPYKEDNITFLFRLLINHLTIAYSEKNYYTDYSPYHSQLQTIRLNIQNTITEKHTIKYYAKQLGVSESYFQHIYSEFFGISFQKDVINIRIENSKFNLLSTNLTIEQIAEGCGYSNEVHFYRQFKAVTGTTPAKYRKHRILLSNSVKKD